MKILTIFLTLGVMLLYFPTNRFVSGGSSLETQLDKYIPLLPVFVIPYLFGLIFWFGTVVYLNLKYQGILVKRFNLAMVLTGVLSVLIYILIPTFVNRPAVTGTDIFSQILSWVYANDRAYNAAPSGHTFNTIVCLLALWKLVPRYRAVWVVVSGLVIVSTVFTKQHNILDVLWGAVFALVIYWISCKVYNQLKLGKNHE